MQTLDLPCPAKLNLYLSVVGRRDDGYHELQTLFQLLDYGDTLQLKLDRSGELSLQPELANIATIDNLVYRAAKLLRATTGCKLGAQMTLNKILPSGGGIGGGSSDAASALLGLNALWQTQLSIKELSLLGRQLGADVPVFVEGRSAWAEGIGEQLTAVELAEKWFVVLVPNCHVSTAQVFSHKDLTRDSKRIKVRASLKEGGKNDCQPLVEKLFPQVKNAVDWLSQFGHAQMTGTGACVFASFASQVDAQAVLAKRPRRLDGFVAKGVNQSPLHQRLRRQVSNWGVAKW